jgi:MSHA biogenesis protein MshO
VKVRGATLIELVVTIVLIGLLAGSATVVLVPAYEAYFAGQRRAELADAADTALRRLVRDVRLALPNSARVGGSDRIEILLTRTGGRYRAAPDSDAGTGEQWLDFTDDTPTDFDVFQPLPASQVPADQRPQANDHAVIHNLGIPGADAYDFTAANPNAKRVQSFSFSSGALGNESRITLAGGANRYPLESPGLRYFVVSGPVTYVCVGVGTAGGNGTGELRRWSGYTYDPALPSPLAYSALPPAALPPGASEAVLVSNVSDCAFTYTNSLNNLSRGLVGIRLALTRANETVALFFQAHINNVP